jgi:5-(carboxyamino)imidazole ribonucleotide mutase
MTPKKDKPGKPSVGIIMGSQSDWATLKPAAAILDELGVAHETAIVSAHRTPDRMAAYAKGAGERGLKVIIAGAGGAAHLPGMLASKCVLPVLGVPIPATMLQGMDSLLSIVQMPKGVPVGTLAVGKPGAANAGLLAVEILATNDAALREKLKAWRAARRDEVLQQKLPEPKG